MPTCLNCNKPLRHTHGDHFRCEHCGRQYEAVILPKPAKQDIDYFNFAVETLRTIAGGIQCERSLISAESSEQSATRY